MKIRAHKGTLEDSLQTQKEISPDLLSISRYIYDRTGRYYTSDEIAVKEYAYDDRLGEMQYIITVNGDTYGFCNELVSN